MNQQRVTLFDLLKGAAILMVCITHFGWQDRERLDLLFPFWISMAVPVFMLVTGYLTAASFDRKGLGLRETFRPAGLLSKALRFWKPLAVLLALELLLEPAVNGRHLSPGEVLSAFLTGGLGKFGTYYVPVLLQMLLLFPLVYALLRKDPRNILLCFGANLFYELFRDSLGVTADDYRLLAFRYLFLISMGGWLYFRRDSLRLRLLLPMLALGGFYIYLVSYTDYVPVIFTRWRTTSMMTAFYAAPILALLLRYGRGLRCPFLEKLGGASYHIFLMQMLYYNYIKHLIPFQSRPLRLVLGVGICLASGLLFYALDQRLSAARKLRLREKDRLPGRPLPTRWHLQQESV